MASGRSPFLLRSTVVGLAEAQSPQTGDKFHMQFEVH